MEASSQSSSTSPLPQLHILLVDPWADARPALVRVLRETYQVTLEHSAEGAVQCVRQQKPSMIILDAGAENTEILRQIEEYDKQIPLLLIGHHLPDEYEGEGFKHSALKMWLDHTIVSRSLYTQIANLQAAERPERTFGRFVTCSSEVIATFLILERVVNTDVPILITGESGSGKELIARGAHDTSNRKDHPFVAINCAAIPENLLETELFGYEKGAFTGAIATKQGNWSMSVEARSSWMNWARCPCLRRPSCCVCCKSRPLSEWAGTSLSCFARGLLQPPIKTWPKRLGSVPFAKTFCIA